MKRKILKLLFTQILLLVFAVSVEGRSYHLIASSERVDHGGVNRPVQRTADKAILVEIVDNVLSFPASLLEAKIILVDKFGNQVYSCNLDSTMLELPEQLKGMFILHVVVQNVDYYGEISL